MDSHTAPLNLTRKKSFWRIRHKAFSENNPLISGIESSNSRVLGREASTSGEEQEVTKSTKEKLHRILNWIKSWSKKERHLDNTYQQLQNHSPTSTPPAEVQRSLPEFARASRISPEPVSALDGANDFLPSEVISGQIQQASLFHRQSHQQLRTGLKPPLAPSLKHSNSSPGFLRRKLSQRFQGTVIRRSCSRPLNILRPLPLNFFPDSPSVEYNPPQRSVHAFPNSIPRADDAQPTLRTVEVTAAAKTYLESHFSELLTFPTSRSLRRRQFEHQIQRKIPSEHERILLREEWMRKETAYLRSLRSQQLTVGNYEIVKVIGKGAFGVVKLVREKDRQSSSYDSTRRDTDQEHMESSNNGSALLVRDSRSNHCDESRTLLAESIGNVSQPTGCEREPKVYALKVMQKADMLTGGQEGHLRAERDFLVASQGSKWIVPLVAAFQDQDNLYLVMEYLIGGDFLALLIKRTVLTEEETRFYAAEMICCIQEAHALGYIHRDIKPDNFLFTSQGHLKLCDFGLAFSGHRTHDGEYLDQQRHSLMTKVGIVVEGDTMDRRESRRMLTSLNENIAPQSLRMNSTEDNKPLSWMKTDRGLARSMVGTNQYMAPEVVRGDAYDGRCDWWSLGIIIYECLYGYTPFYAGNRSETRQKILNWRDTLTFPLQPEISPQTYHLVASLLCKKQHRLTSRAYASNDIRGQSDHAQPGHRNITVSHEGIQSDRLSNSMSQTRRRITHVLPHDDTEIRAHPFFKGINWQKLHTTKAPFVPEGLRGADDTKYFEEDSYQISIDNSSSANNDPPPPMVTNAVTPPGRNKEVDSKKRARDKLLRDPVHGQELLALRKEVAFWGYTYRRPKTLDSLSNEVTGRRRVTLAGSAGTTPAAMTRRTMPNCELRVSANDGEYSGSTLNEEMSEI